MKQIRATIKNAKYLLDSQKNRLISDLEVEDDDYTLLCTDDVKYIIKEYLNRELGLHYNELSPNEDRQITFFAQDVILGIKDQNEIEEEQNAG